MADPIQTILDCIPPDQSIDIAQLRHCCGERIGMAMRQHEFDPALQALIKRGDVVQSGQSIRRCEPDFAESALEERIAPLLESDYVFAELGANRSLSVFHCSARGGAQGSGQFSRPDFTLAMIRQRKYDPLRYLDVVTFELKNGAGTNLVAVHETLAHTRFANYSYLVCPRPHLRPERLESIQNACAELGVGLAVFDIVSPSAPPVLRNFAFVSHPKRRNPDPATVEKYLEDRLPSEKLTMLAQFARSP